MSYDKQEPKFFTSVLTDIDANKHYCACLSFHETLAITLNKVIDEEDEATASVSGIGGAKFQAVITGSTSGGGSGSNSIISHHSVMYAPKCLVLISRLDYGDTFKVSLIRNISKHILLCAL